MRRFKIPRLPMVAGALLALAACGTIEDQCRERFGGNEAAYDQCVQDQYTDLRRMLRDQRLIHQSIPDTSFPGP